MQYLASRTSKMLATRRQGLQWPCRACLLVAAVLVAKEARRSALRALTPSTTSGKRRHGSLLSTSCCQQGALQQAADSCTHCEPGILDQDAANKVFCG